MRGRTGRCSRGQLRKQKREERKYFDERTDIYQKLEKLVLPRHRLGKKKGPKPGKEKRESPPER